MSSSPPPTPSVLLTPTDVGRELYSVRPTAGPLAWLVLLALVVGAFVLGLVVPEGGTTGGLAAATGALGFFGLLYASGYLDKHRVCENALVLGASPWPGGHAYLIPWGTVAADSLTLHAPANRPGRPVAEMGSRGARAAVYSTRAVSVVGLHADLAHPRRRRRSQFARQLLATKTAAEIAEQPPLTRWAMGVRRPEPLLRAIEDALTRHHRGAAGIADRAMANPMSGGHPAP